MKIIKEGNVYEHFPKICITCPRCGAQFIIDLNDFYETLIVNDIEIHRYSCPTQGCTQKFDIDPTEWEPPVIIQIHKESN